MKKFDDDSVREWLEETSKNFMPGMENSAIVMSIIPEGR